MKVLETVAELEMRRGNWTSEGGVMGDEVFQKEDLDCVALFLNSSSTQTALHLLNTFPYLPLSYLSEPSKSGSITIPLSFI